MNTIEPSKSSRATCKTCNNKIDKGAARLGVETEFSMGGEIVTSIKWHHLSCGINKIPDAVLTAEIISEVTSRGKPITLSQEDLELISTFKKEHNKAGVAIVEISKIDEADKTVNIKAKVLKAMAASTREFPDGGEKWGKTVYVIDNDGNRSRINFWEDHASVEVNRDDEIVVLEAVSYLGGNDKIQFHAMPNSVVLVNPDEDDLEQHSDSIELFVADSWKRPSGKAAQFEIAPSGRATCVECQKKIDKGDLKVVKPVYLEIERKEKTMTVPGNISFHVLCAINDEHGIDVLKEAITRLSLDQISDNTDILHTLADQLPKGVTKEILQKLL